MGANPQLMINTRLSPGQHLGFKQKQSQQLRQQMLAPQLQLAMQLLPLGAAQLGAYLRQQIDNNPALDWRSKTSSHSQISGDPSARSAIDIALATTAQTTGLNDHLLWQLQLEVVNDQLRECAEIIIDALDRDGYLRTQLSALQQQLDHTGITDVGKQLWDAALKLIQAFEPTGVGARNLAECLCLQLEQNHAGDTHQVLAVQLVEQHLDELARPDVNVLAAQLNCDAEDIAAAVALIHSLNPRPGRAFDDSPATYIQPDLRFVPDSGNNHLASGSDHTQTGDTVFSAELIHPFSQHLQLSDQSTGSAAQRREAQSLLSALALREQSLLRVGMLLARYQAGFLTHGVDAIRALTRVQVAEQLELHPSTITRALQDKYAETPSGIIPLKDFFSTALKKPATHTPLRAGQSDQPPAAAAARARLLTLINNEDPHKPLSDAQLCRRLHQAGFPLARRTVVKYRQQLGIENSRKRREVS